MQQQKVVVIGDGWCAMGAVAAIAGGAPEGSGTQVHWLVGTGARMLAPLPTLEYGPGVQAWRLVAGLLGIELAPAQVGNTLREFKNKAFREPAWGRAPTPETRREVRDEVLWGPETRIAPAFEARFEMPLAEIEERMRERLVSMPAVKRCGGVPVQALRIEKIDGSNRVTGVVLGSGELIACDHVIWADRWSELSAIEGMPKGLSFARGREPMGALQVVFNHAEPIGAGVTECFFGALQREAGEEVQRNLWGYFSPDGMRSYWTLVITPQEAEDNHEIAKKFRRMKHAIDRMFSSAEWLPAGKKDFMANVTGEQVRFDDGTLFSAGDAPETFASAPGISGLQFITDGYGPSPALRQVAAALSIELPPSEELILDSLGQGSRSPEPGADAGPAGA
jgi:hypothetical protein